MSLVNKTVEWCDAITKLCLNCVKGADHFKCSLYTYTKKKFFCEAWANIEWDVVGCVKIYKLDLHKFTETHTRRSVIFCWALKWKWCLRLQNGNEKGKKSWNFHLDHHSMIENFEMSLSFKFHPITFCNDLLIRKHLMNTIWICISKKCVKERANYLDLIKLLNRR